MRHTEETLSKHPKVRKIKTIICVCGKSVHIDRNYDPNLDRHVKKRICKSNDVTRFCPVKNSETSKKKENFILD